MIKKPSVSIIILNFNGFEDSKECLMSLVKTNYPNFKIFFVDNGSVKNEAKAMSKIFTDKNLKFIHFNKNYGFALGNNKLIRKLKSKYIVLLNNDTVVDKNWLSELIKVAESDKMIVACQPKIRSYFKPEFFEYAGAAGGFLDKLGYPYARGRVLFHLEKDVGQYDEVADIVWASGTAMLLKKSILTDLELLPEDFFFYHEETDLCWRLKNLGFRIVFAPGSIVFHKGASSSKKNLFKRTYFIHRNSLMLVSRNNSFRTLVWLLPLRILMDMLTSGYYLLQGRPTYVIAILKAHISFIILFPSIVLRKLKQKKTPFDSQKNFLPFSIVWEYFINKKRRFNEIVDKRSKRVPTIKYEDVIKLNSAENSKNQLHYSK